MDPWWSMSRTGRFVSEVDRRFLSPELRADADRCKSPKSFGTFLCALAADICIELVGDDAQLSESKQNP